MLLDQGHTCGLRGCLGCWGSISLGCCDGCLFGRHCWPHVIKTHPCVLSRNGYGKVGPRWLALQRHMGELHPKVSYTPTPQPENHPKQKTQEKASWGEGEGGGASQMASQSARCVDSQLCRLCSCADFTHHQSHYNRTTTGEKLPQACSDTRLRERSCRFQTAPATVGGSGCQDGRRCIDSQLIWTVCSDFGPF